MIDNNIDIFYANLLHDFKNKFESGKNYSGDYIKTCIDGLILRIR